MSSSMNGTTMDDGTIPALWRRYEQLKNVELRKDLLIEELLARYEYLSEQHKNECADHEREREYNRTSQRKDKDLQQNILRLHNILNRDPFVLVLVDGDAMIFQDALLQEAEAGGKKAAGLLQSAVMSFLESAVAELPSDTKVVTRIYANLRGLSDVCAKAGIVDNPSKAEGFMRGFTRGRTLFDFVDVGYGKDRADGKMTEVFKLHLYDYRCRQILFGCSHDNGYARLLEELSIDEECRNRVTLIGGVPLEKELADLSFKKTRFQTLFRTTKINTHQQPEFVSDFRPVTYDTNAFPSTLNQTSGLVTPQSTNVSSTVTSSEWPSLATGTWAAAAKNAPPFVPGQSTLSAAKIIAQKSSAPTQIPRNRKGQRIDPSLKGIYDKDEIARIKRMKMCNVHYLHA
ncbi:hypothetical protein B0A49_04582 [Cryomyces minteri]|uniref:DUF7923 domain-containing protein n=1 Tax=Cryomyces minteri TaxID=331657 RepID=A0A4U0WVB1_9PEZI|nr:hypothetical protein B0A49_04582 [Cryomyces minteri]